MFYVLPGDENTKVYTYDIVYYGTALIVRSSDAYLRWHKLWGRVDEPLDADGQLYGHCEEQQQRLVWRGQVNAAVEANKEHALDEQRTEHHRIPEPGAQSDGGACQDGRLSAHETADRGTHEQTTQQRLSQEQMSPAGLRLPRLAQHKYLRRRREKGYFWTFKLAIFDTHSKTTTTLEINRFPDSF